MVGPPPESWSVDPAKVGAFEVRPGLWTLRLPVAWSDITTSTPTCSSGPTAASRSSTAARRATTAAGTRSSGRDRARRPRRSTDVRELDDHPRPLRPLRRRPPLVDGERLHDADAPRPRGVHGRDGRARARSRPRAAAARSARACPSDLVDALYADVREETEGARRRSRRSSRSAKAMRFESVHGRWVDARDPGPRAEPPRLPPAREPAAARRRPRSRGLLAVVRLRLHPRHRRRVRRLVRPRRRSSTSGPPSRATAARSRTRHDLVASHRAIPRAAAGGHRGGDRAGAHPRLRPLRARLRRAAPTDQGRVWQMVEMVAYLRHLRLTGRIVRDETGETFSYRPRHDHRRPRPDLLLLSTLPFAEHPFERPADLDAPAPLTVPGRDRRRGPRRDDARRSTSASAASPSSCSTATRRSAPPASPRGGSRCRSARSRSSPASASRTASRRRR